MIEGQGTIEIRAKIKFPIYTMNKILFSGLSEEDQLIIGQWHSFITVSCSAVTKLCKGNKSMQYL